MMQSDMLSRVVTALLGFAIIPISVELRVTHEHLNIDEFRRWQLSGTVKAISLAWLL